MSGPTNQSEARRVTSVERQTRIDALTEFMNQAQENRELKAIVAFCAEQFGVTESCARKYCHDALRQRGDLSEPKRAALRGKTDMDIQRMLDMAWATENLNAVGKAIELRIKLFGLAAPEVIEHRDGDAWRTFFHEVGINIPGNGDARKHEELPQ